MYIKCRSISKYVPTYYKYIGIHTHICIPSIYIHSLHLSSENLGISKSPVVMSTHSTQILVSKCHYTLKGKSAP